MEISGKPRIVIWFVTFDDRFYSASYMFKDCPGVTSIDLSSFDISQITMMTGMFYNCQFLKSIDFGTSIGMSKIAKVATALNLDVNKLLADWIVCIPGFTLEKYRRLQRSQLSIFAIDCFGGVLSNTMGLMFRSPFVNLFMSPKDYIRFLRSPRVYMEEKLIFEKTAFEKNLGINYPVYTMGNVSIHMSHYHNFDEALKIWNNRKQRINWYNLFIEMYTTEQEILEQFDELPYGKKVCFVPFKSNLDSAFYINPDIKKDLNIDFGTLTRFFARGDSPSYYDMFDMMLYGKKTPLIEM